MDIEKEIERQFNIIIQKAEEVFPKEELYNKIKKSIVEKRPLKVKFGIDPTGTELHLGHAVPLRKLREFQDLGHEVNLIIGTFTAKIGDPTGKNETRKMLTDEEIRENLKTYLEQASKILDIKKLKVLYNGDWLAKLTFTNLIEILSHFTVSQMTSREDFANRLKNNIPVSLVELMYPMMQGNDSVEMHADIELGGMDQKFNLLRGRDLQRAFNQEQQVCLVFPILEGTYGKEKMSKSLNNYIGVTEKANDIFGKIMSIPDSLILTYFKLTTNRSIKEVEQLRDEVSQNPFEMKKRLGEEIVRFYHSKDEAKKAREYFEAVFSKKEIHEEIRELILNQNISLLELVVKENEVSKSEARRLILAGAVKINNEKAENTDKIIEPNNQIIKIGKKNIFKIIKG